MAIMKEVYYISATIQMPETAVKYVDKLLQFAESLGNTSNAYTLCKYPNWKRRNLQCVTYDKTWIFAFRVIKNKVVIFYIKNGKLLNY